MPRLVEPNWAPVYDKIIIVGLSHFDGSLNPFAGQFFACSHDLAIGLYGIGKRSVGIEECLSLGITRCGKGNLTRHANARETCGNRRDSGRHIVGIGLIVGYIHAAYLFLILKVIELGSLSACNVDAVHAIVAVIGHTPIHRVGGRIDNSIGNIFSSNTGSAYQCHFAGAVVYLVEIAVVFNSVQNTVGREHMRVNIS